MLIFMKNAKKFLSTEGTSLRAIHYQQGRVYASNPHSCIWVEDATGKEGAFDTVANCMVESAAIPNYGKLLPELCGNEPYATVGVGELTELLAVLKAAIACVPNRKTIECVLLVWSQDGLVAYTRGHGLRLDYRLSGEADSLRHIEEPSLYAAFAAQRLSDIVDYFRQRKVPVRFYSPRSRYAPLRLEVDPNIISAAPAGGLLAPLSKFEKERFADVIPIEAGSEEA